MTALDAESLIIRPKQVYDGALPSGNSVAALILMRLFSLTKSEKYRIQAEGVFRFFSSSDTQSPYAHSFLLSSLCWYLKGPLEITFQGSENDPTIAKMLKVLYKYFIPLKALRLERSLDQGQARICFRGTCKLPVFSVNDFEGLITDLQDISL